MSTISKKLESNLSISLISTLGERVVIDKENATMCFSSTDRTFEQTKHLIEFLSEANKILLAVSIELKFGSKSK